MLAPKLHEWLPVAPVALFGLIRRQADRLIRFLDLTKKIEDLWAPRVDLREQRVSIGGPLLLVQRVGVVGQQERFAFVDAAVPARRGLWLLARRGVIVRKTI